MKAMSFSLVLFTFLLSGISYAQDLKEFVSHDSWDALLKKYVADNGKVDYEGFYDDASAVDAYCELLEKHVPDNNWPLKEKKAYYINLYNVKVIQLIISKYPVGSINDVADKPFDKQIVNFNGRAVSLNDLEKKILIKQFQDPRIHFAINCAALSCPRLSNKAFTVNNVEKELDRLAKEFILSGANSLSEKNVQLSKIFEWYAEEFIAHSGSVLAYVQGVSGMTFHPKVKVSYLEYDWKLNKK